jgi:dihydroorotase-like cyclic amidohydrolase
MLTWEDSQGNLGKVNPPLRTAADNDALWEAVLNGTITTIGSDHIARSLEDKGGSVWDAKAGFPGVYAILPIMFSEGHT